ncbi:glycoside hydrolase family 43 protein [Paenibacillus glycanilyticus]|uniref:glycoside hydrolase family 43 protein n=1 Tax=Paenibacillus glycanilyticus TaxID=126569 RepID=UPI00203DC072|nr:glycoside hydrolase family 43 protein [Paenibacillus glycanilyticus]MCM3629425.1 glycoside hydrolase family 43 protein [Paenibacillus glycanilyticus]
MKRSLIGIGIAVVLAAGGGGIWMMTQKQDEVKVREALAWDRTYQNPIVLDQEWEDYGIGDPYVLRYNGKYYLYCSTKDWRVGIKAWSSDDLVNWSYEGLVTEEPLTEGAYAPEVVYWNGSFYMYTSPAGKGHYVLQSDSPTGPFAVKTDNLGLTIDGSVFIDDDAKWYFTHAESGGIMASSMSDPYTIDAGNKLNTSLGHWTEGSMIIKRGGTYYMTYTGNHVFSKGYRVNYAVAHDSPTGLYAIPDNNPIIMSTDKDFNGLGHSATVLGPDMDSYYIVYHNLAGKSAEGPPVRKLNMDRLTFNGDKMSVLGPTHGMPAPAPSLPAFRDSLGDDSPGNERWEQADVAGADKAWVTTVTTEDRFTAEYNFVVDKEQSSPASGELEAIFSYADPASYRSVRIHPASRSISLLNSEAGEELQQASLPEGMDFAKLHTVRVEADRNGTRVYWDGLLLIDNTQLTAKAGRIGYAWSGGLHPGLHYTAFSNEAGGSSDNQTIKQVPGTMEAVHASSMASNDIVLHQEGTPDGSYSAELKGEDAELAFPVYVRADGDYAVAAMVEDTSAGSTLVVEAGGAKRTVKLKARNFATEDDTSEWMKVPLGTFPMKKGMQWLTVAKGKGNPNIRFIETSEAAASEGRQEIAFDPDSTFGDWQVESGAIGLLVDSNNAMIFGGDTRWTDMEVGVEVTQTEAAEGEASILLRTTNESSFRDQVTDSFIGYELALRNGRMILRKISYEVNQELTSGVLELENGKAHPIRIKLEGASIEVYDGDNDEPVLAWTDRNALLHGRVGLRASSAGWQFSNMTVNTKS